MSADARWTRMKEIYFQALDLPASERAPFLDSACPDPTLRAEIDRLLTQSDETATRPTLDSLVPPVNAAEPLAPGSLIGHYRIKQRLGAGGMGWVYEAQDERLRRPVALKVLPPGLDDPAQRRRLLREAQAASALNHPNIITVYEAGSVDAIDFIAMERVDGDTLRKRIGRNGIPLPEAVRIAAQIASALAAAHEARIVHRDLKPSNVMVTPRGLVKVLDFGIAKQTARLSADDEQTISRTGEVIGTLSYMSPEQALGSAVDARSDVFSFGALLYEMVSGRRAFPADGDDALRAVVKSEPDPLRDLVPNLPRSLDRLIAKCLRKQPHDRWQDMADVRSLLDDLARDFELPPETAAPAKPALRVPAAALAALLAAALGASAAWYYASRPAPEPRRVLRRVTSEDGLAITPAISRDGVLIAFASDRAGSGGLDIWMQQVDGRDPIRLTSDPADESEPDFSPDSSRVVFRSEKNGGGIYVIPALGGDPILLAPAGRAPRFSPDGRFVAYWSGREGSLFPDAAHVYVVESTGGAPRRLDPGMAWTRAPLWSPDGRALIVEGMRTPAVDSRDWWLLPLDGGDPRPLGAAAATGTARLRLLVPPLARAGGLLYALDSGDAYNLWELPVDDAFRPDGPPRRRTLGPGRQLHAAYAAANGLARTVFSDETRNVDIWAAPLAPEAPPRRLSQRLSPDWAPSISAAGDRLAYISGRFGNWSLLLRDLATGAEKTLASENRRMLFAKLSPDGSRVVYTNSRLDILSVPTAGGAAERLCSGCGTVSGLSRDGAAVIYEPVENEDLILLDAASRRSRPIALRPGPKTLITGGVLSPDARWAAFALTDSTAGSSRLFAVPVHPDRPARADEWIPLSAENELARDPAWSADGATVYFTAERDGFRCIWARRLDPATRRPAGEPFEVRPFHSARQSLRNIGPLNQLVGLHVSAKEMVYAVAGMSASIWLEETALGK